MGTLELTGTSEMKITPEMTVIRITIDGETKDYQGAIRKNAERLKELKDIIESNGIKKEDIKTMDFSVRARWNTYEVDYKKKSEIKGYNYHQILQFKFPNDNIKLSKISYAVSDIKEKPGISIDFITEREKEYDKQLLAEAIKDAISKADVLKEAGGFKILGIKEITTRGDEYGYGYERYRPLYSKSNSYRCYDKEPEIDVEPREFVLQKTVNVVWNIE